MSFAAVLAEETIDPLAALALAAFRRLRTV